MTRQKSRLFKPEVYEAMQRTLKGSSRYRGAEEAFEMFYADKQLQEFLRAYAKREGIVEVQKGAAFGGGYSRKPRFSQAGEDRGILLFDDSKMCGHFDFDDFGVSRPGIYIGPRQDRDAALMIYTHLGEIVEGQSTGLAAGEVIKGDSWRIKVDTFFGGERDFINFDGRSFPVSQAPLFQRISKKDILSGLEKALESLLDRD